MWVALDFDHLESGYFKKTNHPYGAIMNIETINLFTLALGMQKPWYCTKVEFKPGKPGLLDIWVDFERGSRFICPDCKTDGCRVHDTAGKEWRHLDFFQHECYLHARVPRVSCPECGVHLIEVPWARKGSGFTLLFEAMVIAMSEHMAVSEVSNTVAEFDTKLWRILRHYVGEARKKQSYEEVTSIGIDETARARGHEYVSIFVDMDTRSVLYATPGKGSDTIEAFTKDLVEHAGEAKKITEVSMDMSPAFISGVGVHLPNARKAFDRFHIMQHAAKATDQVRRDEQKTEKDLQKTRYIWLKNPENLKEKEKETFANLSKRNLKTVRAYNLRMALHDLWEQKAEDVVAYLERWCSWAIRSRLRPMIAIVRMIRRHWDGIIWSAISKLSNGVVEGINSKIQVARNRARGYRNVRNFITMIYIVAGDLQFDLPT
jgi:transposase